MLPLVVRYAPDFLRARWTFRDYKPQPVTFRSISRWLAQFQHEDRKAVLGLLSRVEYISEGRAEDLLVGLNENLLSRLRQSGIPQENIIYVQMHDPGSSSAVMLNMVRDASGLERRGCHFIDWKDVRGLIDLTRRLENGAIVYVDDFCGTGSQFCEVRGFLADHIVGTFPEFLLVLSICEEAMYRLGRRGVEAVSGPVHSKADRPLHPNSTLLHPEVKRRLTDICYKIDRAGGLGYGDLATMVVLYRNAPNTVPTILRGNVRQDFVGILPRTTDLPAVSAI
jgi:hypothetical protein